MDNDKFRLEARRLIRKKRLSREERIAGVSALSESYAGDDADVLEKLADCILREEISDERPYKVLYEEYPILSNDQIRRRVRSEAPIEILDNVRSDYRRLISYVTLEERLKATIDRESAYYKEINRDQPVSTRRMTEKERSQVRPTPSSLFRGPNHVEWSLDVRRRDDFTCQRCGKRRRKGLHAHHIEAYNTAIDLRYDINNGITLCKSCHTEFHGIHGHGGNTREQLTEWMGMYDEIGL